MNFSQRTRGIVRAFAIVLSLAVPLAMAISAADARVGGGSSSGSRGSKTYSAPPSTTTAPNAAQPMNRTFSQPGAPAAAGAAAGAAKGGFFSRPGMGMMMGGLAAGFLGAGLFGMLSGGGLLGGLGGMASIIGLILQIGLILIVVKLAMSWWQRRHTPANAYANSAAGPAAGSAPPQTGFGSGMGFGLGSSTPAPLEIGPSDYEAFERLLGEVQAAWSNEDVAKLHTLATPEMVSYFTKDLEQNKANNDVNKVSDVKLLQGDLAEAWREGQTDYASVAMRFSLVDKTLERGTNRLVSGSETPIEATEVWTFARQSGGQWELSAIQQTN
ncbi:Tim44-like domain-containing protein [Bradyrhizobium sp. AUGA SZCCT0431]|uniref:Tim44 domain-containing protein n=1 Tax=Bradyrhizobium sp. AUGA SZCCT0431 TaxID=2807674 RepID=UPI001BA841A9|nr:Tim44-like domain-containing protein [Bradyrhizobium sp. AUGA SZCCT0431]MBR1146842.1 Tim44 domain-containing protein [Bradyrhizobium sp. AUGA SZCCT0431]